MALALFAPHHAAYSHKRISKGHSKRPSVSCSFSFLSRGATQLLFGLQQQQQRLLQQAEEITFSISPATNPHWRESLEEAESMLELCIQERPQHLQPRVLLLRNLLRQSLGREQDVPALALQALQEADLPNAEASMMRHLHVLQIVLLGLKATYKVQDECEAAPMPTAAGPQYTPKSFLAAAKAAAPSFGPEFDKLSLKVQRQLVCCSPETRASLLQDRVGFMSSVDLSAVCGEHHAVVGRGAAMSGGPSVIG